MHRKPLGLTMRRPSAAHARAELVDRDEPIVPVNRKGGGEMVDGGRPARKGAKLKPRKASRLPPGSAYTAWIIAKNRQR